MKLLHRIYHRKDFQKLTEILENPQLYAKHLEDDSSESNSETNSMMESEDGDLESLKIPESEDDESTDN